MEDERRYRFTKPPPLKVIDGDYAAQPTPPPRGWRSKFFEYVGIAWLVVGSAVFLWFGMHWALLAALVVWIVVKIYDIVTAHSKRR